VNLKIPTSMLYIWVLAIVMVIAFWGALSLSRVLWKSACSRSNMKPKSIPKQARKWIEQLFCWFQDASGASATLHDPFVLHSFACIVLHFPFICIFLSLCIRFLAFSFHVPFIGIHFHSFWFHLPSIFIPMCIHVLSSSFHLHACSFHFAFMSFHFLSKVEMALSMAWPGTSGNRVQQMVIAKLSLRLSLNNPSNIYNIWHCSKEICHKTTEEEREWASWMPNAIVTAGNRAPQVEFPSSVLPALWMCTTVFAWFTPSLMDCRVWSQVIAFGEGPIGPYRFTVFREFRAHLRQKLELMQYIAT